MDFQHNCIEDQLMFRAHGPRLPRTYTNLLGLLTFISSSKQEQIIKVHTLHCGSHVNNVNYVNFTCTIRQCHLTGFIIVHLIILSNEKKATLRRKPNHLCYHSHLNEEKNSDPTFMWLPSYPSHPSQTKL